MFESAKIIEIQRFRGLFSLGRTARFSITVGIQEYAGEHDQPVGTSKANGHDLVDSNDQKTNR